jgi:hypothetical protein
MTRMQPARRAPAAKRPVYEHEGGREGEPRVTLRRLTFTASLALMPRLCRGPVAPQCRVGRRESESRHLRNLRNLRMFPPA